MPRRQLTPSDRMLCLLRCSGPLDNTSLARQMNLTPARLRQVRSDLCNRGLMKTDDVEEKTDHGGTRRTRFYDITELGRQQFDKLMQREVACSH